MANARKDRVAVYPEIQAAAIIAATHLLISGKIQNSKGSFEDPPSVKDVVALADQIVREFAKISN
jgi:hypothetical protein